MPSRREFPPVPQIPEVPQMPELPQKPEKPELRELPELPPIWENSVVVEEEKVEKIEQIEQIEQPVLYNSTSVYTDGVVIGQVFDTYIILQYGKEMVLIDQHAAHEKVLYERTMKQLEQAELPAQQVAPPLILT